MILINQSGRDFAHVTTALLSCHMQNLCPDSSLYFYVRAICILRRFQLWVHESFVKQTLAFAWMISIFIPCYDHDVVYQPDKVGNMTTCGATSDDKVGIMTTCGATNDNKVSILTMPCFHNGHFIAPPVLCLQSTETRDGNWWSYNDLYLHQAALLDHCLLHSTQYWSCVLDHFSPTR